MKAIDLIIHANKAQLIYKVSILCCIVTGLFPNTVF